MNEETLLKKRVRNWYRLNELCNKAERGFRRLSGDEVIEYVRLYRQASADLAQFMTHSSNQDVIDYLNSLVGRAYAQFYRKRNNPIGAVVVGALRSTAQTVRRRIFFILTAFLIFLFAGGWGFGALSMRPDLREFIIPAGAEGNFDHWKKREFDPRSGEEGILATAMYASNNPVVSMKTNALGAASFGVLTVVILWENGKQLGALTYEMATVGGAGFLYSSILPHGITEIGGIFMAGGGGLLLGWALIRPGRRTRLDAIKIAGKDALVLVLLSVAMTLMAAPVEGFFSFEPRIPPFVKIAFAAATLVAWTAFFLGYARDEEPVVDELLDPPPVRKAVGQRARA